MVIKIISGSLADSILGKPQKLLSFQYDRVRFSVFSSECFFYFYL